MDPPLADLLAHLLHRLGADRGLKAREHLPVSSAGAPGPERVPQERERGVLIRAAPPVVLAVHDLGLGRVQPQPDLLHPAGERRQHHAGFPFRRAVHDCVIRITLELHDREFPCQVQIKRIMHEQVSQDG